MRGGRHKEAGALQLDTWAVNLHKIATGAQAFIRGQELFNLNKALSKKKCMIFYLMPANFSMPALCIILNGNLYFQRLLLFFVIH